jgi:hypothetical protein
MTTSDAIIATLSDSGPANIGELFAVLYATRGKINHEHVCLELFGLVRADKVSVSMGIYQLKGE